MSGLFAINKPSGISSAGLLNDLQNILKVSPLFEAEIKAQQARTNAGRKGRKQKFGNKIKMGHGGTLDPLASGVLVVGTGRATKDLGKFLNCSKDYEAIALFGCSTDTYDSEGKVVHRRPWQHITKEKLESTLEKFRGDIMQTPPIYSALKMQGKPLYEYAREGKPLPAEIKARPATVSRFEVTKMVTDHDWVFPKEDAPIEIVLSAEALQNVHGEQTTTHKPQACDVSEPGTSKQHDQQASEPPSKRRRQQSPSIVDSQDTQPMSDLSGSLHSKSHGLAIHLNMTVSSGTYVRSLIHDLGLALGSAAHMVALVRKRVGEFRLEDSIAWPEFEQGTWQPSLKTKIDFGNESEIPMSSVASPPEAMPLEPYNAKAVQAQIMAFLDPCKPFKITLTYAQSIDAKISGPNSKPLTISCRESSQLTHELRRIHKCILVGVGTAKSDDPGLNARTPDGEALPMEEQPMPVILDPNARFVLTDKSKMMQNYYHGKGKRPLQLVSKDCTPPNETCAIVKSIQSHYKDSGRVFAWTNVLSKLAEFGDSVMIEGGASIIKDVLHHDVADQVIVTIAPTYIGDGTALSLESSVKFADTRSQIFGRDTVIVGRTTKALTRTMS